ncbi:MAG: small multi-drug export protein [Candidatus Ratteibacteria bacterium]|nr:small multi-drug export protein [Candidatus Ratteibacteria bacterium]
MIENIIRALQGLPTELVVIIISALPISELRGGIPLGMALYGFSAVKSFWLAVIGNFIPVIPLLLLFKPVREFLNKWKPLKTFFDWFCERTKRNAKVVEKYEAIGLALFVAVPLPFTGAWTGCVAAMLFKLNFKYSLMAILVGIFIAGVIVAILSTAGIGLIEHFQSLNG